MHSEFSEMAFSHAVLAELFLRRRPITAPYFPSQVLEAWAPFDLEYALTRAQSMFVQFKVSSWMKNRSAEEYPTIKQKYFRFDLLRREIDATTKTSAQHNLLKFLSEQKHGRVYYVAPLFYLYNDYEHLSSTSKALQESLFLDFDLDHLSYILDDNLHRIAFLPDASAAWQCSNPREIGAGRRGSAVLDDLLQSSHDSPDFGKEEREQLELPWERIDELRDLKSDLAAGVHKHLDMEVSTSQVPGFWLERWARKSNSVREAAALMFDVDSICRRYYNVTWFRY